MSWSDVKLSAFKDVLQRQPPQVAGQPFVMQPFSNDLPKLVGDPWHGAYSKHGFWYKFRLAKKEDYDYVTARAIENESNYLLYESFNLGKNHGTTFLIAENQRNEIIGCASKTNLPNGTVLLGSYFVDQNYRHSGIGSKLIKDLMNKASANYIFYSPSFLLRKVHPTLGLNPLGDDWTFQRVIVGDMKDTTDIDIPNVTNANELLDTLEFKDIVEFDQQICGFSRASYLSCLLKQSKADSRGDVTAFCVSMETTRNDVKQLWIGPWYALDCTSAEKVLNRCISASEEISEIHFMIPKLNSQAYDIVSKLNGKMRIERIKYQACASRAPSVDLSKVFGTGDLNSQLL